MGRLSRLFRMVASSDRMCAEAVHVPEAGETILDVLDAVDAVASESRLICHAGSGPLCDHMEPDENVR